jgi:membrane-associated protease RseP (regulator of RpoE activity)
MRRDSRRDARRQGVEVVYVRDGVTEEDHADDGRAEDTPGHETFEQRPGGRGVLGVDDNGDRVRVPNSNIYGVELDDVNRNGPADIAGLKEGDIIIKFGEPIRTAGDLRYRIAEARPARTVPVTVVRGAEQIEIPVKIGRSRD